VAEHEPNWQNVSPMAEHEPNWQNVSPMAEHEPNWQNVSPMAEHEPNWQNVSPMAEPEVNRCYCHAAKDVFVVPLGHKTVQQAVQQKYCLLY